MRIRFRTTLLVGGMLLGSCSAATGQGMAPPVAPTAVPAAPDTALALVELPEEAPTVTAWTLQPDTVTFGGSVVLVPVALPEDSSLPDLSTEADWLVPVVPESPGFLARLTRSAPAAAPWPAFRVYRTDPFRLQVGSWTSPVIHVRGRAAGTDEVAGVRTPAWPGWPWGRWLALVLGTGLVVLLLVWLWGRRRGPVVWPDREVPPSVWPDTARGLRDLLAEGSLARGDARRFLDALAGLARAYVAGRYGVAAVEMTGREIVAACRRAGHRGDEVRFLAELIDEADLRRYDPEPPAPGWCRERAAEFYRRVQATRVLPRHTPAAPDRIREAETAWTEVARELDPTGRLLADTRTGGA